MCSGVPRSIAVGGAGLTGHAIRCVAHRRAVIGAYLTVLNGTSFLLALATRVLRPSDVCGLDVPMSVLE